MTWTIKWTPKSTRVLKKLPQDIAIRLQSKIESIIGDPFRYLEHYEGVGYKMRIGDYRVLIDVDTKAKLLKVRVLDKRGRVYKR